MGVSGDRCSAKMATISVRINIEFFTKLPSGDSYLPIDLQLKKLPFQVRQPPFQAGRQL